MAYCVGMGFKHPHPSTTGKTWEILTSKDSKSRSIMAQLCSMGIASKAATAFGCRNSIAPGGWIGMAGLIQKGILPHRNWEWFMEPKYYAFRRWLDTPIIIWEYDWMPRVWSGLMNTIGVGWLAMRLESPPFRNHFHGHLIGRGPTTRSLGTTTTVIMVINHLLSWMILQV